MGVKHIGAPAPDLSGENFVYEIGQNDPVPGLQEQIKREREECPNPSCTLMSFCRIDKELKTISAGAFCINACLRLPEVVVNIK